MRALLTAFALSSVAFAIGCSNPIDEIDELVDCANICDRYRDCYDESYDASACRDRCEGLTDSDPNAADSCDACLDDRSCVEATFTCGPDCVGIIP